MFILGALTVLGGDSLTDFALALLIGLVIGTASSVFTASPLAVLLEKRWPVNRAPAMASPTSRTSKGQRPAGVRERGGREVAAVGSATVGGTDDGPVRDRWSSVDPYADIPTGRDSSGASH
jgi:hypothetical protein